MPGTAEQTEFIEYPPFLEGPKLPPPPTYDEYLETASEALEQAVKLENKEGLKAAAPDYETAASNLIRAIASTPIRSGGIIEDPEPKVLIEYGSCLAKLVECDYVKPYESGRGNRKRDIKEIAAKHSRLALEKMIESDEDEETIAVAALAVAQTVDIVEDGKEGFDEVIDEVSEALEDTNPHLAEVISTFSGPERDLQATKSHIASVAILDLAKESTDSLAMVA